jgi:hypothetical protein
VDLPPLSEWFSSAWAKYRANREDLIPFATFIAGSIVAWAALKLNLNSKRAILAGSRA